MTEAANDAVNVDAAGQGPELPSDSLVAKLVMRRQERQEEAGSIARSIFDYDPRSR